MHADSLPHNSGIRADKQYNFYHKLPNLHYILWVLPKKIQLAANSIVVNFLYVGLVVVKY